MEKEAMLTTDEVVLNDFLSNVSKLKEHIDSMRKKVDSHIHHGWNYNPVFDKKLEIHKTILELEKQQTELSKGIIALLEVISEAELTKIIRMPMPPPPKPGSRHFV
ncbi:hypothetical protein JXA85_02775 [Candidatus Woesearchaeota archaeon]|nr:hypothetical protein [Candidatus Woesearchaeota archaeon]